MNAMLCATDLSALIGLKCQGKYDIGNHFGDTILAAFIEHAPNRSHALLRVAAVTIMGVTYVADFTEVCFEAQVKNEV